MLSLKTIQLTSAPLISLFVGGCLVIISEYRPVQAQIVNRKLILAQTALPQLQPQYNQVVEFYQNNQNYQTTPNTQISQYGQYGENTARYIVYVNSDNYDILQRVRQVESTAYIRQLNGSRIIQSGVFSKQSNAQRRVRELEVYGITNTGILTFSNPGSMKPITSNPGREVSTSNYYNNNNTNYYNDFRDNNNQNDPNTNYNTISVNQRSRYYYVVIPTSSNNLQLLGQEIQQKIGTNANIYLRTKPRGTHIAVGGFTERSQAEQWNNYLQSLGYGNARVYYGQ